MVVITMVITRSVDGRVAVCVCDIIAYCTTTSEAEMYLAAGIPNLLRAPWSLKDGSVVAVKASLTPISTPY